MSGKPEPMPAFDAGAGWLQVIDGERPILLIAPHGGRAGAAARARLHPRVNDLHTAEITRELSRRLRAPALINGTLDRNALDCNRVEDIARKAPWMLTMLAARLEEMVARHGRAVVLVIHGWNVVEARIDFGLGARVQGGKLTAVASAHLTAGRDFIEGPLAHLCSQLQISGILPTFGLRYPAAGRNNLLQVFTPRFNQSRLAPLRNLAGLASAGAIDALQLELSMALRWPGALREKTIALLTETFARPSRPASAKPIAFSRPHNPIRAARQKARPASAMPMRFGVEIYDPARRVGAMASMDLNGGGGARVIMLFPDGRVALCTAEGKLELHRNRIVRGPLQLAVQGRTVTVEFRGPALIVPDAAAYLRMERALETGSIDHYAAFRCTLAMDSASGPIGFNPQFAARGTSQAGFGPCGGEIVAGGFNQTLEGVGRVGIALLGQPERAFTSRVSLWSYFAGGRPRQAVEARLARESGAQPATRGRLLTDDTALECRVETMRTGAWAPGGAPARIDAVLAHAGGAMTVSARPQCFMALSRPGAAGSRIHTSLGFAAFELDGRAGAGMFECSRAVHAPGQQEDSE